MLPLGLRSGLAHRRDALLQAHAHSDRRHVFRAMLLGSKLGSLRAPDDRDMLAESTAHQLDCPAHVFGRHFSRSKHLRDQRQRIVFRS